MNTNQGTDQAEEPLERLMISGFVQLVRDAKPVYVQRGMLVKARNGLTVGRVAAVVRDCNCQEITHLLLGQVPPTAVYHLIPLSSIDRITGGKIWLLNSPNEILRLPLYQMDT